MLDTLDTKYYKWLCSLVDDKNYITIYHKLLLKLYTTKFKAIMPRDDNRADDGIAMQYRFCLEKGYDYRTVLDDSKDCSVLEMMVALSVRMEEDITMKPGENHIPQWFWGMVNNLGLERQTNSFFDEKAVDDILNRFMKRKYSPNGKGGLFTVKDRGDIRRVEIWYQMCWYLDDLIV